MDVEARPSFDVHVNVATYRSLVAANEASGGKDTNVSLREYRIAQEEQENIRDAWRRFFETYDILICPSHCTPAFRKDESPKAGRTLDLTVDGRPTTMKYFRALFWALLTNVGHLPSTTFPCGLGRRTGMPVGLNAVGAEWSDMITIRFAELLEIECGALCRFRIPKPLADKKARL